MKHRSVALILAGWVLGAGPLAAEMVFVSTTPSMTSSLIPPPTGQTLILTDPELIHSVVPPPSSPVEPPPQLRLPDAIVDSRQWRGLQCGVTQPRIALFRHEDNWHSFWERGLAPYLSRRYGKAPPVDFAKDMIIGVFLGERPDPHYAIEIRSIKPLKRPEGDALVVRYREIRLMTGIFNPPFPVQPFHLRKVPRFDGEVLFEQVKR